MIQGLDVSHYQGYVDWFAKRTQGYQFAFMKATEGVHVIDDTFAFNWKNGHEAMLFTGAYHFFHPSVDPINQANSFLAVMGKLRTGDLPPALDWEVADGMTPEFQKQCALKWLETVERELGVTPIVYSDVGFLRQLGDLSLFSKYPLWVAETGVSRPNLGNLAWGDWTFWQYNQSPVDLDYFRGSLEDLKALAVK